jgi:hypothetical protein
VRQARAGAALAALGMAGLALWLARDAGVAGPGAIPDAARGLAAAVAFWGLGGYALARTCLPAALAPWWPLLAVPIGACSTSLAMTILGFAAMPFVANVAIVAAASAAAAYWTHRRVPGGIHPGTLEPAWLRLGMPTYLAVLVVAIALLPVFRTGYVTVVGDGSDSHLAVGSATFLQQAYPTSTDVSLPVDRVPIVWRSKVPIYYGLAATAWLAGLDPVDTIAAVSALLAGLAALGFYFVARQLARAGPLAALLALLLVGMNGIVLFTVGHPYFNQTWGLLAMPYAIVLSWLALVAPRRGTAVLAALFWAVGGFAYPLMLAFPATALAAFAFFHARQRAAEGRPIRWREPLRRLPREKRWWPLYLVALLAFAQPILGVAEKVGSGFLVVVRGESLAAWGGDLLYYPALHRFFSLIDVGIATPFAVAAVCIAFLVGLRSAPKAVGLGFLVTALAAGFFITYFANATAGQYFYFKTLAYLSPLVVTFAVCALVAALTAGVLRGRLGVAVPAGALVVAYLAVGVLAARKEIDRTFPQVYKTQRQLSEWSRQLPAEASIRLDLRPGAQLWAAYFLHRHPLSSRAPIIHTSYPHVVKGRKADYVVASAEKPKPGDAAGRPLFRNRDFVLYRMRADVPGRDRSSRRMAQPIKSVGIA